MDKPIENIVLFGGTFDPIHLGHIGIAKQALKVLGASKVVFILAKNPCWKTPSSCDSRLTLLEMALKNEPNMIISRYEVEAEEEVNYTINTARHFKRRYPEAHFYFLIGFDQVNNLDRWHEIDELAKLVEFVAVARPGYPRNHELIRKYHVKVIECQEYPYSSTSIKELRSLALPSKEILDYIIDNDLYFVRTVKAYMSEKRYLHSLSVANLAYQIAERNNFPPMIAFLAGYIHDIARECQDDDLNRIMAEHYPCYLDLPIYTYHQFVGSYMAEYYFKINDERIINAIKYHTTGRPSMSILEKIIYAADKIEPLRNYDSEAMIEACMKNISSGFKIVVKENNIFQKANYDDGFDNRLSKETYHYYIKGGKIDGK